MSKIEKFRFFIKKINVDAFIINTKDEYLNEYLGELIKICDFTGTNGLIIITKNDKCPFFTDGRYITQATNQLNHNDFQIYNIEKNNPIKWIKKNSISIKLLGYYIQSFTLKEIREYSYICKLIPFSIKKKISNNVQQKIVIHHFSGESSKNKCKKIAKNIDNKAEAMLITDINSISWLVNLRNENFKYTPCILGRALLYNNGKIDLFIQNKKCSGIEKINLHDHINVFDIKKLKNSLSIINSVIIDPNTITMNIVNILKNKKIFEKDNPCLLYKAVKNQVEIIGAMNAHIRDGIAVTNFIYWIKNNIHNKITELEAENKLLKYKKQQIFFKQISFPTISAFNENGSIIHYKATYKTNKIIKKNGLYLIDSGSQYLDGTTDATRTIAIGNPTNKQIKHYTIVLKAHIAIASAIFPSGTTGGELDILARTHLWKYGMDYLHSTGHGVGSYLSVHEGPQAISKGNKVKIIPGMILSNEPGYYIPKKYGIRIENLMYVKKQQNGFLSFEQLTFIPYDKNLINIQILNKDEIKWINIYHNHVYKKLKNNIKNKKWLKKICNPL